VPKRSRFADERFRQRTLTEAGESTTEVHFVRDAADPRAVCGTLMVGSREAPIRYVWSDMCSTCRRIMQREAVDALDRFLGH
jgi:hypothetical protein